MKITATNLDPVPRIDELLELSYRSQDLGNVDDVLAETVYILLSKQTREAVYQRVFRDLRDRCPKWLDVLALSRDELVAILQPAGIQEQRARHLTEVLERCRVENERRSLGPYANPDGDLTLEFLHDLSDREAERFLTSLPGIGTKSARCVLAYSLQRPAFAVDTHVHRIFSRLEIASSSGRKRDHDPFQEAVPERIRKRLHINLVHHGREVCRSEPKCHDCVLVSFCKEGRRNVADKADSRPVAVDLFAGAGGLGLGFRNAGFRVALAVESSRHAAQTYRLNHPGVPVLEAEISKSTTAKTLRAFAPGLEKVHAVLAGPPCQGYSAAGSRNPDDHRNGFFKLVINLAKELKADALVLEQVPGLRKVNGQGFLDSIRNAMKRAGYAGKEHLVHACSFGVPQHRARYIFLGRRDGKPPMPAPEATHVAHADEPVPPHATKTPTLTEVLSALPELPHSSDAEYLIHDGRPFYNMSTMRHSQRVVDKIAEILPGGGPISYRRLESHEARTLIAGHRAMPVHPRLHRTISVREAAVIQGFPLDYVFCGPKAEQPLQVANAVPPPMAKAVAMHVIASMDWSRDERKKAGRKKTSKSDKLPFAQSANQ